MIRVAGINENDVVNGEGVSVSLFLQGCPLHCKGCHNPETWNPDGGEEWDEQHLMLKILNALGANDIHRNLSILGGEPLDTDKKINFIEWLINMVKNLYPQTKIIIWTGYQYEDLKNNPKLNYIFQNIDYLIEGPFILEERDITLKWRGSRNQRIIDMKQTLLDKEVKLYTE